MSWRCRIAVLGVPSLGWVSGTQGQHPGQAPTATGSAESEITTQSADSAIKVQVNLVLVRVVVRDAGGKVVPGLKQEDFQVLDNGKKQKISAFSVETAATPTMPGRVALTETGNGAGGEAGTGLVGAAAMPKRHGYR